MDRVAWSLLILGDLDPYPPLNPPSPSLPTATAKSPFDGVHVKLPPYQTAA